MSARGLVVLGFVLGACRFNQTPAADDPWAPNTTRSLVPGVPTTLAEVRARARPGVTVEVTRETVTSDVSTAGGNCGHSAACAVMFLLPRKGTHVFDVATITSGGRRIYQATFETDGQLAAARAESGGWARYLGNRWLPSLAVHLIAEEARAPLGPDGNEGERVATPLAGQIDFAGAEPAYLRHLERDQEHGQHKPGSLGESLARQELKARMTIDLMFQDLGGDAPAMARRLAAEPSLHDSIKTMLRERR